MDKELQQLQSLFTDGSVEVRKCGIGKVNAALGAQQMISEFRPDVIISSGCAGGNGDDVNVQDVVVSTELCYHDVYCGTAIDHSTQYGQVQGMPARFQADPRLLAKARQLADGDHALAIHPGLIVTGDWFASSATSRCATPMPHSIITSGTPLPSTLSISPRHLSNHSNHQLLSWKSFRVSPSTTPT